MKIPARQNFAQNFGQKSNRKKVNFLTPPKKVIKNII